MLQRKRKTKIPCAGCFLHLQRCICAQIPSLDLRTKLTLLIHARELKRTTNTGRLAVKALINSEMIVRGIEGQPADLSSLKSQEYENLLFFPSESAVELTPEFVSALNRPVRLIVPDGNWRQASKVATRHAELEKIQHVKITSPNRAEHHLRKEHFEEGMSTLQAIAQALRVLEGEIVYNSLNQLYEAKLFATLEGRGTIMANSSQLRS